MTGWLFFFEVEEQRSFTAIPLGRGKSPADSLASEEQYTCTVRPRDSFDGRAESLKGRSGGTTPVAH